MYVNPDHLNKLDNELLDVSRALVLGKTIWMLCQSDGWVKTQQINLHLSRSDYHIGETAPE